ncbi:MAG: tRNA (5-methylaminomethyl-2-thiouridine)(34)-methyltransferase MnmD [Flavobacteriales bacterium]|nr:tRNA (5-methylaminomethyl-2-thiouridine)(34)-methyltransferase MnmD [Flavobacteriales bacterium]
MKRTWITTTDGSKSLYVSELDETYHSRHGAVTESMHVFITNGLDLLQAQQHIRILEVGFGTGINALLTLQNAGSRSINYEALEPYPLTEQEWAELDAPLFERAEKVDFASLSHGGDIDLSPTFNLKIIPQTLQDAHFTGPYHLVYYDAFGPGAQPEMWLPQCFQKVYDAMENNGIFVTYCAKGQVRRDLISCGFQVERLPGPPGKREMLRATKVIHG